MRLPIPEDRVWTDDERVAPFANDEAARGERPLAVAFPESTEEVSKLLAHANAHGIPVIARGAGSGLSGAAISTKDAIVLSTARLDRIVSVGDADLVAVVEPGVITGDLRRAAEAKGLLYAPIPASVDFCTIGGNVATNAGGLCAVKYGVTREHVLGLTAVLATGEVIETGGRFKKSSTGYDLTQLLCGSEGTLAVITRIIVRLLPLPPEKMTMLVPFDSTRALTEGVVAVLEGHVIPPTMEFLPKGAVRKVLAKHDLPFPFPEREATLLVEMDGRDAAVVAEQTAHVAEILAKKGGGDAVVAQTKTQRDELWTLRKQVRDSIATSGEYVEADSVVPRSKLPEMHDAAMEAGRREGLETISYGHAGDGNLHTYYLRGAMEDARWKAAGTAALTYLFEVTAKLGGTISGEHGIGSLKKAYLPIAMSGEQIALMKRIKSAFDPNGILNPGKVFP